MYKYSQRSLNNLEGLKRLNNLTSNLLSIGQILIIE